MKWNLKMRILVGFLAIAVITGIGYGITVVKMKTNAAMIEHVRQTYFSVYKSCAKLAPNIEKQISLYRMYTIASDPKALDQFKQVADENDRIEARLIEVSSSEKAKELARDIRDVNRRYSNLIIEKLVPLIQAGHKEQAHRQMLAEGSPLAVEMSEKVASLSEMAAQGTDSRLEIILSESVFIAYLSIGLGVAIFLFSVCVGIFSARSIAVPITELAGFMKNLAMGDLRSRSQIKREDEIGFLSETANQMVDHVKALIAQIQATAEQVASSSRQLSSSADQSAEVSQTVASSITTVSESTVRQVQAIASATEVIEEISKDIKKSELTINHAAEYTKDAVSTAEAGNRTIDEAVKQITNVEETVNASAAVVARLGERSKEIGQIVDTISGIAGQTNLLALNAAIEAARAGEHGKGFAVVAEDVRRLAEQSQGAAKKIASLIAQIRADTDNAVCAMNAGTQEVKTGASVVQAAGAAFTNIFQKVNEVNHQASDMTSMLKHIADNAKEAVAAAKEIDEAGKSIASESQSVSAATQEQSATMEEMASASRVLSNLAQDLNRMSGKFKI